VERVSKGAVLVLVRDKSVPFDTAFAALQPTQDALRNSPNN
jgi:hypothetical protein